MWHVVQKTIALHVAQLPPACCGTIDIPAAVRAVQAFHEICSCKASRQRAAQSHARGMSGPMVWAEQSRQLPARPAFPQQTSEI